jgi:hypothetical protein
MFTENKKIKILPILVVVLSVVSVLIATHQAQADWWPPSTWGSDIVANGLAGVTGKFVGFFVYIINYFISMVLAIVIVVEAWFIQVVLQINDNIVNTLVVQSGFTVTLAIANLGFVMGIIVIALATILKRETYGIKQILWKLVVAAIIVNFSLVIGGIIINFANTMTKSFMTAFPGQGGGYFTFASRVASMFQPQQFASVDTSKTDVQNVGSQLGTDIGSVIAPIFSLVYASVFLVFIIIILGVFIFMLMARYVILSILLILMPLAWLTWVFPKLSSNFSKWWNTFIRWCFFAPIVIFFLWLVINTAAIMDQNTTLNPLNPDTISANFQSTSSNPLIAAVSNFFGAMLTPIIKNSLNAFVLIGLTVGGIIAANSLSIAGAGAAIGAVKTVGGAVQGWAGRIGKKGLRATGRALGVENLAERMRTGQVPGVSKIPGLRELVATGGRRLAGVMSNKELVDRMSKEVPDDPEEIKKNLAGPMATERRMAHLNRLAQMNELDDDVMVGSQKFSEWKDTHQADFANYGQDKLNKDGNKILGGDKEMRDAAKALEAGEKDVKDASGKTVDAAELLQKASDRFVKGLNRADMSKMQVNRIFSDKTSKEHRQALLGSFAANAPQLIPNLMPKAKSNALKMLKTDFSDDMIREKREAVMKDTSLSVEEIEETLARLDDAQKIFKDSWSNNALGFIPAEGAVTAAQQAGGGGTAAATTKTP